MKTGTDHALPDFPDPVSLEALTAFSGLKQSIVAAAAERILTEHQDQVAVHGEKAEERIVAGLGYVVSVLEPVMRLGEFSLLADQQEWGRTRLPHDGVQPEHVRKNLIVLNETARNLLPRPYGDEICAYFEWMIAYQQKLTG